MWQFFKRQQKDNQREETEQQEIQKKAMEQRRRQMAFSKIVAEIGNFSDFANHVETLKFWLPEAAKTALENVSERYDLSASEFLRQFLAVHCYGLYAFYQMTETVPKLFKDSKPDGSKIRFSLRMDESTKTKKRIDTYWIPELGKNVAPIKVWIPKRMKGDLQTLAEHVELTPSNYVREILISRLLGHGMLPQRITMFKTFPAQAADDWVEDSEICWREVSEEDFRASTCDIKEVRTEWVDSFNEYEMN